MKESVISEVKVKENVSPPKISDIKVKVKDVSPPKASQTKALSPPKVASPVVKEFPKKEAPKHILSPKDNAERGSPKKNVFKEILPPLSTFKCNRVDSKAEDNNVNVNKVNKMPVLKDVPVAKELPLKIETREVVKPVENTDSKRDEAIDSKTENISHVLKIDKNDESSNGVGDKIKKFEKAAEDANVTLGRQSRPGSVRGRPRTERLGSDSKEDFPPPATPFKDNIQFDLTTPPEKPQNNLEKQHSITKNNIKWQRSESTSDAEKPVVKPEPQKIIKPEFKPIASPSEITIRSPSLGSKIADQFPSHGTAFRNVASPDTNRNREPPKQNEDSNTHNNIKPCKFKNKEKISVSKGSSYFTRGSEEIWLVKKKDIEEIEERVLDSFRRAGGNVCMRNESVRPSSDSGHGVSFSHATMGRTKRPMYARSESLDPQWAGARSQTLKRQTSVACTCGHDKKTRAKSAGADARPRSRSHGDDNNQSHVLDKYETLV